MPYKNADDRRRNQRKYHRELLQRRRETGKCIGCGEPEACYMYCWQCREKERVRSCWRCHCRAPVTVEGCDHGG